MPNTLFYTYLRSITFLLPLLRSLNGFPTSSNSYEMSNHKDLSLILNENEHLSSPIVREMSTAELWFKLLTIFTLVILGGVFAGLTIGLMGLDETNLQVLVMSGEFDERKHAKAVLALLNRGKHWVLVTLLLSNVIVNETLPIIMDSVWGGGWPAVLISTALIVLFGEFVLLLMYFMYPVAYPIAALLDYCLGEHHGTMYRKSELKTFVSLHKNGGIESLNEDEVTIISAVLELREKPVSAVMTPLADVYTLSAHHVLDQKTVDEILTAGYSRIPIYEPPNPTNFIGMLLVKKLISYDPEDALPVNTLPVNGITLSSLPETAPETSCLDILNFFQEGRSHMVLVTENPGGEGGALGVITLEDVIEELIGEEIIDETDVYVDVHKKVEVIRRPPRQMKPRPFLAMHRTTGARANHPNWGRTLSTERATNNNKDDAAINNSKSRSRSRSPESVRNTSDIVIDKRRARKLGKNEDKIINSPQVSSPTSGVLGTSAPTNSNSNVRYGSIENSSRVDVQHKNEINSNGNLNNHNELKGKRLPDRDDEFEETQYQQQQQQHSELEPLLKNS
ncbi:11194_t:CDS:2 [Ambispora leptoticha]|uniref:11194_t:CDS:1 n=1 Tax=Ambispora leptoticha TaxID=144679 RepID=A0A9N8WJ58_9GLOM|nr:11194_t:CDS:2 [Ambispora leptoticha]